MNQNLDPAEWPSILFEGEPLPQSLSGISILIDCDITGRTADWIWRLPHCRGVWKSGDADWCISSADEIIAYLLGHRDEMIAGIQGRLGVHGFDGVETFGEWLTALARIRSLAEAAEKECRWIAGEPSQEAEEKLGRILGRLDKNALAEP